MADVTGSEAAGSAGAGVGGSAVVWQGPAATEAAGRRFASLLTAGDVVLLTGPLGAGKTTFVRGLGDGLGVRGPVTSPTFVIARSHPSLTDGVRLVHVDAYRLDSTGALADLDLEAELDDAVIVVEWGAGKAEFLSDDRVEVTIAREGDSRTVEVEGTGDRWRGVDAIGALRGDSR